MDIACWEKDGIKSNEYMGHRESESGVPLFCEQPSMD